MFPAVPAQTAVGPATEHVRLRAAVESLVRVPPGIQPSQGGSRACRATTAVALNRARNTGYLILVPRQRELAGG